jgi:hypothetical protein
VLVAALVGAPFPTVAIGGGDSARARTAAVEASRTQTLALDAPLAYIAADGPRVAFIAGSTPTDCQHVAVWTPGTKSLRRFGLPAPCDNQDAIGPLALAGTRVAWLWTSGSGTYMETNVVTATLARPAPPWLYTADASARRGTNVGTFARRPVGQRTLLAFTVEQSCDSDSHAFPDEACPPGRETGDIVAATLFRLGGPGPCPFSPRTRPRACTTVAKANSTLTVLAVDAGRIAVRTETGLRVFTARGDIQRDFAVKPSAVALSGRRLAVRTLAAIQVYDVDSGALAIRFDVPSAIRLEDLEGDILVTASGRTVTLERLGDRRKITIRASGTAHARLERLGLFVAGARRLTFIPMHDVRRRFGG